MSFNAGWATPMPPRSPNGRLPSRCGAPDRSRAGRRSPSGSTGKPRSRTGTAGRCRGGEGGIGVGPGLDFGRLLAAGRACEVELLVVRAGHVSRSGRHGRGRDAWESRRPRSRRASPARGWASRGGRGARRARSPARRPSGRSTRGGRRRSDNLLRAPDMPHRSVGQSPRGAHSSEPARSPIRVSTIAAGTA